MVAMGGSGKRKRRFFAVASLGKSRWYWVVWPSLEEVLASEEPLLLVGEGYAATKAEAVDRALELGGIYAEWIAARYAEDYHRSKAITAGKSARTPASNASRAPSLQEFLYRDVYDEQSRQWTSLPHRVAKRTGKYVFVEQQPYSPGDLTGSWLDRDRPTFRLDRRALEQEGYAFIPATAALGETEEPVFYSSARLESTARLSFQCLSLLGLSWPCSEAEVRAAYRRLARDAHPDGGGNHDRFLALQEAYEQALRLCP